MAGDASQWLKDQGMEDLMAASLLALRLPTLPPKTRRDVVHHSVISLTEALTI